MSAPPTPEVDPQLATRRPRAPAVAVACLVFATFALPASMLGVVWPDLRTDLGQAAGALGLLTAAYGVGRGAMSASGGLLITRVGIGRAMAAAMGALAAAAAGAAAAPSWAVLLAAVATVGLASGALDSLGARYLATVGDVGQVGLVQGSYGIGATAGPFVAGAVGGWRLAFAVAAAAAACAAVTLTAARDRWPAALARGGPRPRRPEPNLPPAPASASEPALTAAAPSQPTRPVRGAVVVSVAVFGCYVGLEVTTGAWALTFLTEVHGVGERAAGAAVACFWAGITAGRLACVRLRPSAAWLPSIGVTLTVLAVAIAVAPGAVALLAVPLVGLVLAPVVTTVLAGTADRVGAVAAGRTTGFMLLAANAGATGTPFVAGLLVAPFGTRAVAWLPVALAVLGLPLLTRIAAGGQRRGGGQRTRRLATS